MKSTLKALSILSLLSAVSMAGAADKQPNILFILADDLGWADTTLYGQTTFYKTPNIQRLADRGMLFTRAYSANPLCSPTRSSILSGINPARTGYTSAAGHVDAVRIDKKVNARGPAWAKACGVSQITRLDPKYVTLAEALKSAGYATGHFGKWHVGFNRPGHPEDRYEPKDQGFDVDIPSVPHASGPLGGYTASLSEFPAMGVWEPDSPDANVEDFICDEAIQYMKAHRDEPFFLNYWAYSVHAPFDSKPELVEKYAKEVDPNGTQRYPVYAAMVEVFDDTVGRLLDALDRLGIADNTIVVFYSDNGGNMYDKRGGYPVTSNAPLRGGKATIYEGGSRIPAAMIWPGQIKPGSSTDALISSTDWYPTLLEMAGVSMPSGVDLDGVSQVPALLGKDAPRKRLLNHFPHYFPVVPNEPAAYLIEGDWKLIRYFCKSDDQQDVFELYNLKEDISESHDLAAQYPERLEQMKQQMVADLEHFEASVPVANPDYKPGAVHSSLIKPDPPIAGWRAYNAGLSAGRGRLILNSRGGDPFIISKPFELQNGPLTVKIRISSTSSGTGQVFYKTKAEDFSTSRRATFSVTHDGAMHLYEVELPEDASVDALRIDPSTSTGRVEIDDVRVINAEGTAVQSWDFENVVPAK